VAHEEGEEQRLLSGDMGTHAITSAGPLPRDCTAVPKRQGDLNRRRPFVHTRVAYRQQCCLKIRAIAGSVGTWCARPRRMPAYRCSPYISEASGWAPSVMSFKGNRHVRQSLGNDKQSLVSRLQQTNERCRSETDLAQRRFGGDHFSLRVVRCRDGAHRQAGLIPLPPPPRCTEIRTVDRDVRRRSEHG
jgi:hypothetical protein